MVHFAPGLPTTADDEWPASACPVVILDRSQATANLAHVTCPDCIIRLLAQFHSQQAILLRTFAGIVAKGIE